MSTRSETSQPLMPGHYYHIYNRANGDHNLFFQEENYDFFLKRYAKYTDKYLDTFSYCLLPNHFHFLVKVKSLEEILDAAASDYPVVPKLLMGSLNKYIASTSNQKILVDFEISDLSAIDELPIDIRGHFGALVAAEQLRRLFLSFSKAINNSIGRQGSLFQKYFRRKLVQKRLYLQWLVWYIHRNPLHHRITRDFRNYKWSSYQSFLTDKPSRLARKEVLSWFDDGIIGFVDYHDFGEVNWKVLSGLSLED